MNCIICIVLYALYSIEMQPRCSTRYRKKLTAKTSWYKQSSKNLKRKYEMDEEEQEEWDERQALKRAKRPPDQARESNQREGAGQGKGTSMKDKNKAKTVLFVPYTIGSILAKRLREAEEGLKGTTGYKIKIVERAGTKLEDLLCRDLAIISESQLTF